jgi:serine/threonine protein phosphatase 1
MVMQRRVYAIGDIHGRADLLERMIRLVAADLDANPCDEPLVITQGDYIDRGPHSRKVIERLAQNPFGVEYTALRGNHEVMLAAFLEDPALAGTWRHNGGLETLHSYGVPVSEVMRGRGLAEALCERY